MDTPHRWALVTGACSGIGLEIGRALAARGYSLVLVSDRETDLAKAADQISTEHGVETRTFTLDLATPDAASELYRYTEQSALEIEVLVSNAGMLLFGEMAEADPDKANALLQLHVVTPSLLARYFGHHMRIRRRGRILVVSSAASWADFPGVALYGASKRYLRSFAAALREELRPWGVTVTCLAPGAVATGLYGRGEGAAAKAARMRLLVDPARVGEAAVRGTLKGRALVLPGASAKLMAIASALTPTWLIRLIRSHTDFLPRPADHPDDI
jgi:short-subunit dehydrogenase